MPEPEGLWVAGADAIFAGMDKSRNAQAAEKRRKDRERQAARRAALRESGRPLTHACDKAIVEALAFQLRKGRVKSNEVASATINVKDLMQTMLAILADREGYDRAECKIALKARIAARPEHEWAGHVPSIHEPGAAPHEIAMAADLAAVNDEIASAA